MSRKTAVLSLAIVAIGFYAMPAALSLFAGQHTFDKAGNATICVKCHSDVYNELHSTLNQIHWKSTAGYPNTQFECIECHNVTNVSQYFNFNIQNRDNAHAATTVACLACHSGLKGLQSGKDVCNSCHAKFNANNPGPDQFPMHALAYKYGQAHNPNRCGQCHRDPDNPTAGDVFIKLINKSITGPDEVHRHYYYNSSYPDNQSEIRLKDSNAACIGCHTRARADLVWVRTGGDVIIVDFVNKTVNMTLNTTQVTTTTNNT